MKKNILIFTMFSVLFINLFADYKTIEYRGEEYKIPKKVERLVITGAVEAVEDALVLGYEPYGVMTVGGEIPKLFESITKDSYTIGDKRSPNFEKILMLNPDLIISTTKADEVTLNKLEKIQITIPVSHYTADWEDNLILMGQITDKELKAEKIIKDYKLKLQENQKYLKEVFKNKTALLIRIRSGNIMIYGKDSYFNESLYSELGLEVPEIIEKTKRQEMISMEKLSEINPNFIFLQFEKNENLDSPEALKDLQKNPIWKNIKAVKDDKVFVNIVNPMAQGGTAYSKISFLDAIIEIFKK
ncbi:MAG: iron complex transport system substrate-binding protein [Oceanotoga sp.]|uniref:ABC transporter substrate-binding protein n=1 Tax=Oceanotoga sp. TaxID=2108366 RepID=UPI0026531ACB|nr:ABC transporter substrate-binding protein [Oceanotoga sp.]MDN5342536.1 iron complex transport system substrate-binding protein [Oceanotoga sp.]